MEVKQGQRSESVDQLFQQETGIREETPLDRLVRGLTGSTHETLEVHLTSIKGFPKYVGGTVKYRFSQQILLTVSRGNGGSGK